MYLSTINDTNLREADALLLTPPPNLTGKLHIGHILNMSIGDFIVRYSYLFHGMKTVPILGFDHAALYAEIVARNMLLSKGLDITKDNIINQIGANCKLFESSITKTYDSYNFLRLDNVCYTNDSVATNIVNKALAKLECYGLIKERYEVFNYDREFNSVVSDLECDIVSEHKKLYYIKYYLYESCFDEYTKTQCHFIVVATTTPFTIESDLLLAVNPSDSKNKFLIGKYAINPLTNKTIEIIACSHVSASFGSGILKVTPFYSKVDAKICESTNFRVTYDLPYNDDLVMNSNSLFHGHKMDLEYLNEIAINILTKHNMVINITTTLSKSIISKRSGNKLIEIALKQQFIDMRQLCKYINTTNNNIQIIGCSGKNEVNRFASELDDWCISRQNIYGHNLDESNKLDTWFSSALWINIIDEYFNTMGEQDIIICTGYDIIFFWIFRMLCMYQFMCNNNGDRRICIIVHGLLCDTSGAKVSKSKGNTTCVDSADNLQIDTNRLRMMLNSVLSKRIKLDDCQLNAATRYINKIKSIFNFIDSKYSLIEPIDMLPCKTLIASIFICKLASYLSNPAVDNIKTISVPFELMNNYLSKVAIAYMHSSTTDFHDSIRSLKLSFGLMLKFAYCVIPYTAKMIYEKLFNDNIGDGLNSSQMVMLLSHNQDVIEIFDCLMNMIWVKKRCCINVRVKCDELLDRFFLAHNKTCHSENITYEDNYLTLVLLKSEVTSLYQFYNSKLVKSNTMSRIFDYFRKQL